ncbi:MAG TPA: hypothetical protein PLA41_00620 [Candidatus Pacearchaeota archaeon]|nr:hypothetical protein [Candidatus Parcubacteria bacterium]HOU45641.1 hypothetical protein [Candidatus Pacearchaeota archaeon]HPM08297.1 hypothetical protein [Candidatus Pacearchaeota archaeon]HQI74570.1 hypothetical protein [Candidatus Pacearchaeota archaeon]
MVKNKNKKILAIVLLMMFLGTGFSLAKMQIDYPGPNPPTEETNLIQYIAYLYNFSIVVCGLLVLWSLISGGYSYLMSRGSPSKISQAKDQIFSAFLGLIILLASYMLLETINPGLLKLELHLSKIEKSADYEPKPKANESQYLVIPLGSFIEQNFYSKEAMEKMAKEGNDVYDLKTEVDNLKKIVDELAQESQKCKCNESKCFGPCPCQRSCPNAFCDKEKINKLAEEIEKQSDLVQEKLAKIQGVENINQEINKMGTLMSLAENKNIDSYYTFLGGKNLLKDSKTKIIEDCEPFSFWDYYWQKNLSDPITFYINKNANKRLINNVLQDNLPGN